MKKEDWYKIFAIGLVLIFVIEGAAIGIMSNGNSGNGEEQAGSGVSMEGHVNANVTIVRYEPYLIVSGGNAAAVEATKEKLVQNGEAAYAVPNGEDLVVSLNSAKSVVADAAEFERANASVLATAAISMPSKLQVVGSGITTTADGSGFSMQIRPVYLEGSVVPSAFTARVENGQLASIYNFGFLPVYVSGAAATVRLLEGGRGEFVVEVPWENRSAAKPIVAAEGASYREKSFIIVQQNASREQLNAALAEGKDYFTAGQSGVVSARNDFADRAKATEILFKYGLEAQFPPSLASFANSSGNDSARALAGKLSELGIGAKVVESRSAKAILPETIRKDGGEYRTGGIAVSFELPDSWAEGGNATLSIDFEAAGNTIYRIVSVKALPSGG